MSISEQRQNNVRLCQVIIVSIVLLLTSAHLIAQEMEFWDFDTHPHDGDQP